MTFEGCIIPIVFAATDELAAKVQDESSLEVDLLAMGLHAEHVGGEGGLEQIGQRRGGPAVDQLSRRPMRVGKPADEGAEPGGNGGCAELDLVREIGRASCRERGC